MGSTADMIAGMGQIQYTADNTVDIAADTTALWLAQQLEQLLGPEHLHLLADWDPVQVEGQQQSVIPDPAMFVLLVEY